MLVLAVLHIGVTVKYRDYFKNADALFVIPGLTDSNLLFYAYDDQRVGQVEVLAGEVPLYYLDSANLVYTAVLPPMS